MTESNAAQVDRSLVPSRDSVLAVAVLNAIPRPRSSEGHDAEGGHQFAECHGADGVGHQIALATEAEQKNGAAASINRRARYS